MRHFISIPEISRQEMEDILGHAVRLKEEWKAGGNPPYFKGKVLAMVFQKPSLRTRVSFDMAMRHLGGDALYLSPNEIGLGKREAISDISQVLSRYVDYVMARVFDHKHIEELAAFSSVPVINGLSDFNHPCQATADVLTILERFGNLQGLNICYVGDGNNVAASLLFISALLGMHFRIATPEQYGLSQDVMNIAEKMAGESGSQISQFNHPQEAVHGAQVIYTDTWVSMGQEEEIATREAVFPPFQVNQNLVGLADPSVIVMHCLPAHRGQEITDEVADGKNSVLFDQAENRLHAQKGILYQLAQDR
jgi:ornithine carbamoyltransferase